jgi:hypothetical protein
MLRNKSYIAIKKYKEHGEIMETKAVWKPIISRTVFNKVQRILDNNHRRKKPKTKNYYPYLLTSITFCKICGDHLCGKSAHGKTKKIGYYEHAWAATRNSTLSSEVLKHNPHRVPAKKLEPIVLKAIKNLFSNENLAKKLFEKSKTNQTKDSKHKEIKSLKTKVYGLSSQLDALTERLAELPTNVPAKPIYDKMSSIQDFKIKTEEQLKNLEAKTTKTEEIASPKDYQSYVESLIKILEENKKPEQTAKIIKKIVKKIEVAEEKVRVHFYIGKSWLSEGLAVAGPSFDLKKIGLIGSSNTLSNGGDGELRTQAFSAYYTKQLNRGFRASR